MAVRIKILPEDLANKIAAGEVVERPASVVKELVENAVDAGARDISVEIRGGGRSFIEVVDDGCGMSREDALLCFERHATSKIASDSDLFEIRTLGFRGEALAAIAGVSKLQLTTRTAESPVATQLSIHGGTLRNVSEVGAPVGTSIRVAKLFYNTPARMKFMKSAAVETGHIIDLVTRLAMAAEGLGVRLLRGPETLVHASQVTTGKDRLVEILGHKLVGNLYPFRASRGGIRVHGWLSSPLESRSGWTALYAFVNKRFMRDQVITRAVSEAYRGIIPKGRYPIAVVFVEVEPREVDVNVHPGKIQVRFARPRTVSELIIESMRHTLVQTPWQPQARSFHLGPQPEFFPDPALDGMESAKQRHNAELLLGDFVDEKQGDMAGDCAVDGAPGTEPQSSSGVQEKGGKEPSSDSMQGRPLLDYSDTTDPEEERAYLESLKDTSIWEEEAEAFRRRRRARGFDTLGQRRVPSEAGPEASSENGSSGPSVPCGSRPSELGPECRPASPNESVEVAGSSKETGQDSPSATEPAAAGAPTQSSTGTGLASARNLPLTGEGPEAVGGASTLSQTLLPSKAPPVIRTSKGDVTPTPPVVTRPPAEIPGVLPGLELRNFSRMRVIGQYANCFILCQDGDELVYIDQHAAHERVTFEKLKAAYDGIGARNQLLLAPVIVDLPRREAELLPDYLEDLTSLGLEVEPFGGATFAVKGVPVALMDEDPAELLVDLVSELSGDIARQPLHERIYMILATMACHGSIRANRKMAPNEMEALLKLLDGTDFSFACPHGRPLVVRKGRREIEKMFKRT